MVKEETTRTEYRRQAPNLRERWRERQYAKTEAQAMMGEYLKPLDFTIYLDTFRNGDQGMCAVRARHLGELAEKRGGEAAYQVADLQALRGETDLAFEWLERAYDQRDPGIAWTMADPFLRSLHADPRWDVFLPKLGLAD